MMKEFAIGIDFGTLSARGVLASLRDGHVVAAAEHAYAHGVMDRALPSGTRLEHGWALQHPRDYLEALYAVVPALMRMSGARGESVAAIGVDFTCATTLPVNASGEPLCETEAFCDEPNAYVKLWKHHATREAEHITRVAREWRLDWLQNSGGKVSAEWLLPKLLQLKRQAPALYERTELYIEAGDWLSWLMCGRLHRSESYAVYKNFYLNGYPDDAFFRAVDPSFAGILDGKMRGNVLPLSQAAGGLTAEMAARLTLAPGTPVCPGQTDSHTGVAAAGLRFSGDMLTILGTSACHILQHERDIPVMGIAGKARGGILPGLTSYEANQSMGELLAWYIDNACPAACTDEAKARGISPHALLSEKAAALAPGQSGLIALDWFNGNRCVLADSELSGMLLGLSLRTRPEEIYLALMEAAAYAMRVICENYEAQGLEIGRIVALGGISRKNPMMMQLLCDVLGRDIAVCEADEGAALGAAITAAAVGGVFADIGEAVAAMAQPSTVVYTPGASQRAHDRLYREYLKLHDHFGRGGSDVMRALADMAARAGAD